ncbi:MAG: hypothetical protein GVY13_16550 [Alphaproteobacteria bacterium]|nr:hypothetical protein [Alphaproteobacteria bacterium]
MDAGDGETDGLSGFYVEEDLTFDIIGLDGDRDEVEFRNLGTIRVLPAGGGGPGGAPGFEVEGIDVLFEGFERILGDASINNSFDLPAMGLVVDGVGGENTALYERAGGPLRIDIVDESLDGGDGTVIARVAKADGTSDDLLTMTEIVAGNADDEAFLSEVHDGMVLDGGPHQSEGDLLSAADLGEGLTFDLAEGTLNGGGTMEFRNFERTSGSRRVILQELKA